MARGTGGGAWLGQRRPQAEVRGWGMGRAAAAWGEQQRHGASSSGMGRAPRPSRCLGHWTRRRRFSFWLRPVDTACQRGQDHGSAMVARTRNAADQTLLDSRGGAMQQREFQRNALYSVPLWTHLKLGHSGISHQKTASLASARGPSSNISEMMPRYGGELWSSPELQTFCAVTFSHGMA